MSATKHANQIKKRIGVQLQSSEYLPNLTLVELINLFASLYSVEVNTKEILAFVDLEEKANSYVKELSGGQKQRFTIATSLVHKPEIIFLDEPTTGLDPGARRKLWALIQKINESGTTVVLTTHYMEEAEILCNRVAIMDNGKILTVNEPQKLIGDLAHTTQISFLIHKEIDENVFKGLPGVEKVYSSFPKVILEIGNLDNISPIINALKEKQIVFAGFTVKTASLEDVYLDLTGQEYLT
jgi:ABC-2 type transport system ATP-binding protein